MQYKISGKTFVENVFCDDDPNDLDYSLHPRVTKHDFNHDFVNHDLKASLRDNVESH